MSDLFLFDENIRESNSIKLIAGFDEAGRGPLAGPLACAGVVLPPSYQNEKINDSKKLTDKKRRELFVEIKNQALAYFVLLVSVETIDKLNILEADRKGMQDCLKELERVVKVDYIITDYMRLKTKIPLLSIPKGDVTSLSVAAASILAKVTRDDYMIELSKKCPEYNFEKNKGYGTKEHLEAIEKFGYIKGVHRASFEPVKSMISRENKLPLF